MHVPEQVLHCVAFCGPLKSDVKEAEVELRATGFFVAVDSIAFPGITEDIYFVTARHVVARLEQFGNGCLRMNKNDGTSLAININKATWYYHPTDSSADVAVTPLARPFGCANKAFPAGALVNEEIKNLNNIGPGDEVFIVGLFTPHGGKKKNLPIIRIGNIAMMPHEPVNIQPFGDADVYLIESRSTGGLSGSPVFIVGRPQADGQRYFYLLGLVHGHYDEKEHTEAASKGKENGKAVNMGIAIVVPANKIMEIINCEELKRTRNEADKERASLYFPKPN